MIALKNNNELADVKILIFDTNIFLMGIDFNLIDGRIYTVPNVIEEIKHRRFLQKNRNILNRVHAAIESKKLILKSPSEKYIQIINEESKKTGDYSALSITDKELIALALELKKSIKEKITLYTNDYSMENLCLAMNIPFSPLIRKGIKSKITWEVYCPFCQETKNVESFNQKCEICGTKLRRRRKK